MRITGVRIYSVSLPFQSGSYAFSSAREFESADSTILAIDTDTGLTGYGEVCPAGASYIPQNSGAARACLAILGPELLGRNPLEIGAINALMDRVMSGHAYAKSPIDIACWDILGQETGKPVYQLLGGKLASSVPAHRAIGLGTVEAARETLAAHRQAGFRHFQLKAGGGIDSDISRIRAVAELLERDEMLSVDANGAWTYHEAMLILRALSDLSFFLEEPCGTYDLCRSVRQHASLPLKLDESITDLRTLLRAHADQAADIVSLKLSKFGGLTGTRLIRDVCGQLGIAMNIECVFGSEITSAAVAHLAISTPPKILLNASHYGNYFSVSLGEGSAKVRDGRIHVEGRPGLGLSIRPEALGRPAAEFALETA